MWIGGGSSNESVELAARLGWKLMLPSAFGNPDFFVPVVDHYLQTWTEYGHKHEPGSSCAGRHVMNCCSNGNVMSKARGSRVIARLTSGCRACSAG